MKTTNGQIGLKYALIFLLVLNITTLGTIGYHLIESRSQKNQAEQLNSLSENTYNGKYFKERLKLAPDQLDSFRQINSKFRQRARDLNQELSQCRRAMMDEMQKDQIDTLILQNLSVRIGGLHQELKVYTYRYYIDLKSMCTLDQQVELKSLFSEFFINEKNPVVNQGGGSNQNRFQHGKRNNN